MWTKARWLEIAEVLDALRVFPRLLLLSSFVFLSWYSVFAINTVIALVDRMSAHSAGDTVSVVVQNIATGVIGITVPMIGTMFAKIADVYMNTGKQWTS